MHFYHTINSNHTKNTQLVSSSTSVPASHYETHYEKKIQDALMWIDLDDEISKPMIHDFNDEEGNPTGRYGIVILGFDFYTKEVGSGSGQNRITTFAYEIRTSPENSTMLKNLLCILLEENINDIKFIPYGLDNITLNNTMREIIILQNSFSTR